jgi:recombinational DNA repair protein (RecF pathway)
MKDKCAICGKYFELDDLYEYRGVIACEKHFDELCEKRDYQRTEIMEELNHKTKPFRGLDMADDSTLGKANREILKKEIDIAKKESLRVKNYEEGKL